MKQRSVRINEIIFDENSSLKPTVVTFQNGEIVPGRESQLTCSVFENARQERILAASSDTMLYAGHLLKDSDIYNNFLMTVDRETSECKLIAVDSALLKAVPHMELQCVSNNKRTSTMSDLHKQFGSKRTKRKTEQFEKFKVNVETIKQDLEQTAGDIHVDEADLVPKTASENNSEYRPPINREATSPEDVYPLEKLVPLHLLETLQEKVDEILKDQEKMKVCEFVEKEISKLARTSSNDANKETKYQLLLYIDCLIGMLKTPARVIGTAKYTACDYSKKLSAYMLDNFTAVSAHGRTRSLAMRDKCICYVLVLTLLACDYTLNLDDLAKDLKHNVKKLSEMSRVLALTQDKNKKNTFVLKLPLPSPVSGQKMSRKRR